MEWICEWREGEKERKREWKEEREEEGGDRRIKEKGRDGEIFRAVRVTLVRFFFRLLIYLYLFAYCVPFYFNFIHFPPFLM